MASITTDQRCAFAVSHKACPERSRRIVLLVVDNAVLLAASLMNPMCQAPVNKKGGKIIL